MFVSSRSAIVIALVIWVGPIVLGVGDVRPFDRRFDRRIVDRRDVDVAGQRVRVHVAVVDGEADGAGQRADGSSLVFW